MIFIGIIVVISLVAIVFSITVPRDTKDDYKSMFGLHYFLWVVIFILAVIVMVDMKAPSALDVYRGNTELKIHSINGVPTDTIVVYKKK